MEDKASSTAKTYVVEHLDPELGPWSTLEYLAVAQESVAADASFCLSSISPTLNVPLDISSCDGTTIEHRGVEEIFEGCKDRVCLLDPAATDELAPEDAGLFDVFLFGGILGGQSLPLDRQCPTLFTSS